VQKIALAAVEDDDDEDEEEEEEEEDEAEEEEEEEEDFVPLRGSFSGIAACNRGSLPLLFSHR
jgi:hypothetical protein